MTDTEPPLRPGAAPFDALVQSSQWTRSASGSEIGRCRLEIHGITCAACAPLIEAAVQQVPGVVGLRVHAASQQAELHWDRHRFDWQTFLAAMESAGYTALPAHTGDLEALQRQERKALVWRLFVAWFCAMQVMMLATPSYVAEPGDIPADLDRLLLVTQWVMTLPVMLFAAGPFFRQAWSAARLGRMAMDVPVAVAVLVLFAASTASTFEPGGPWGTTVWFDSLTMFLAFLLTARWFDQQARHQAARELEALRGSMHPVAHRWAADGQLERIDARHLRVGDRIRVAVGERIPADGTIVWGDTEVGESLLTGESLPIVRRTGEGVLEGSLNVGAPVDVDVSRAGGQTRRQQLVQLAEAAALERPPLVQAADRWAGPFLWVVLVLAVGAGVAWWWVDPARAVGVAVAVLVVTCPCALALAAPSALLTAARVLARRGIVVRHLAALESLSSIQGIVFDKTGTLTHDRLTIESTLWSPDAAVDDRTSQLQLALQLARASRHPASLCLVEALGTQGLASTHDAAVLQVREAVGRGIEAWDHRGRRWRLGRPAWALESPQGDRSAGGEALSCSTVPAEVTVALSVDGCWQVGWVLSDPIRATAPGLIAALQAHGMSSWLLSGDQEERTQRAAAALHMEVLGAAAFPEDKLAALRALQARRGPVAMVGDGVNDVPVLAAASVSLAMGHGSGEALARADFLVLDGRVEQVLSAVLVARSAVSVLRQNFAWALAYNLVAVPLAVAGVLPPWLAGLGMALSSVVVVANSQRIRATAH